MAKYEPFFVDQICFLLFNIYFDISFQSFVSPWKKNRINFVVKILFNDEMIFQVGSVGSSTYKNIIKYFVLFYFVRSVWNIATSHVVVVKYTISIIINDISSSYFVCLFRTWVWLFYIVVTRTCDSLLYWCHDDLVYVKVLFWFYWYLLVFLNPSCSFFLSLSGDILPSMAMREEKTNNYK